MKFAVIVFPGSNCDHDCYHAVKHVIGQSADFVWHKEKDLSGYDAVILPGGFYYGDYLRTGAMLRNRSLQFICKDVYLRVDNIKTPFTCNYVENQIVRMPIAHAEGNYYVDQETYTHLQKNNKIVFRYTGSDGKPVDEVNPNGSIGNIAGVCNEKGNVLGMMPHPERCGEGILGGTDGYILFESMVYYREKVAR